MMSKEEFKPNIELPDGTIITWEEFSKATPHEHITDEIDKDIIEQLKNLNQKQK